MTAWEDLETLTLGSRLWTWCDPAKARESDGAIRHRGRGSGWAYAEGGTTVMVSWSTKARMPDSG